MTEDFEPPPPPPPAAEPSLHIPNSLSIGAYMHCRRCLSERPADESPNSYARLAVGMTKEGLQIWCNRHECNVMHVHFQGIRHPANMTAPQTAEEVADLSARMTDRDLLKAAADGEPVIEVSLGTAHIVRMLIATGSWTSVLGKGAPRSILLTNISSKAHVLLRVGGPGSTWTLKPAEFVQLEGYEGVVDATVVVEPPLTQKEG